jgi:regulatory protein YycI of two-component signal transduction system YycFG
MDFKKILITFIMVFLAMDIFLAFSWLRLQQPVVTPSSTNEILAEMTNEDISFGKMSGKVPYGAYLSGVESGSYLANHQAELASRWQVSMKDDALTATLDEPINLGKNNAAVVASLRKLVRNTTDVIRGSQYAYDRDLSDFGTYQAKSGKVIVFAERVSDNRLFYSTHAQIRFKVTAANKLVSYTQTYVNNPTILRDESQLISQKQALTVVYQFNEISTKSKVLWSKLHYAQLTTINSDTIYVPAWFFAVRDSAGEEKIHKVNAFNGTLMK